MCLPKTIFVGAPLCYTYLYMALSWSESINLKKVCAEYRVGLWQCPQFLFLIMGAVIMLAILTTYAVAIKYQEPEVAALVVLMLAAALFLVGYLIVRSFEKVALASKSKSEFISIMSHQLRSPLSAIKWQLNMLLQGQSQAGASQEYLETIRQQNERMIRSVNDLLEVNRIEDNDLILRPREFSLKELTLKIINEYKNYASAYNVRVALKDGGEPMKIFADEERLGRVIEHLLDNAIRYSTNGGNILVNIEKQNDGKVLWKIADEGRGIPSAEQRRVFEKYFRASDVTRFQTEGSGVGLFIAKSIIKQSGGEMGFSSQESKGSTFWFVLPKAGITS